VFENTRTVTSFSVDDVPAAAEFYGGTLGLEDTEESGILWLHRADGILIYPKPDHVPASYTVRNFVVDDIDEAVDTPLDRGVRLLRYEGLGLDKKGIVRYPDGDITWFADPAGNVHSVSRPRTPRGAS